MNDRTRMPILIGGDLELGNFIVDDSESGKRSDHQASRLLLRQIQGFPLRPGNDPITPGTAYDDDGTHSQDSRRQYLASNGGCAYIDLNHLELATPETLSARDHLASWKAMLRIARQAQIDANAELPRDARVVVLANNSDRQGRSYGGHQSFLMSRAAFDGLLKQRMLPHLFTLMSYQASSLIFTGQGKVGSENGRPFVPFQISQRADFLETLLGEQTTHSRPLVNTRDEPLAGPKGLRAGSNLPGDRYARLHVIFYDTTLAPVATCLKVGVFQLILAMIEANALDDSLILDDPLTAVHTWSRDPDLGATMALRSGKSLTAIELQQCFLAKADAFHADGGFEGVVANALEILTLWDDTLAKLETRDPSLRTRLDWVMKREFLETTLANNPELDWHSQELTYLDLIFSSLDPADSLFLQLESSGCIEDVASEEEIARLVTDPPADTRAYGRAALLRVISEDPDLEITHVDWDEIRIRVRSSQADQISLRLSDPLRGTEAEVGEAVASACGLSALIRNLQRAGILQIDRLAWVPPSTPVSLLDHYRFHPVN